MLREAKPSTDRPTQEQAMRAQLSQAQPRIDQVAGWSTGSGIKPTSRVATCQAIKSKPCEPSELRANPVENASHKTCKKWITETSLTGLIHRRDFGASQKVSETSSHRGKTRLRFCTPLRVGKRLPDQLWEDGADEEGHFECLVKSRELGGLPIRILSLREIGHDCAHKRCVSLCARNRNTFKISP